MNSIFSAGNIQKKARNTGLWVQALVLTFAGFAPLLITSHAHAATQLTSRKVTISDSKASQTGVQYDFTFSWGNTTDVEGAIFQFCTTPLGTCTLPTGMDVSNDLVTLDGHTGFPNNATAFAEVASNTGDCSDTGSASSVTMYCINRTEATTGTGTGATVDLGAIINPSLSSAYTTVYVRVSLYDNDTFTGPAINDGTVAASINRQLTVNGRVQERLDFCVAAVADGGATDTTIPTNWTLANCAATTDTVVDLGAIDNTSVAQSPVDNNPPTSLGNDRYGVAYVNTNASGGVAVTFFAEPATTGTNQLRAFRVTGASCNASSANVLDQCFVSAGGDTTGGDNLTAGTERFGMNIPCIMSDFGGVTTNLTADTDFDNFDATTTSARDCENSDTGDTSAWNDTSTATPIASSSGVVDRELIKIRFAATAGATTPTGAYTVVSTYIATPTF